MGLLQGDAPKFLKLIEKKIFELAVKSKHNSYDSKIGTRLK